MDSFTKMFFDTVILFWRRKKIIIGIVGSLTILSVIISLLWPESFRSQTTILPELSSDKLSQFSSLAGLAGINMGEIPLSDLYPQIIKSESVLIKVLNSKYKTAKQDDSLSLYAYWEISGENEIIKFEKAFSRLDKSIEINVDRNTKIISVSVVSPEAQLSADILTQLTNHLDGFLRTSRITQASEKREWIEKRLREVKVDLQKAENSLKQFREKNRIIVSSPLLQLEQNRLQREVEINSLIYGELKKQFEMARIEEIRDTPIINVLDSPRPPATREFPKRKIMVLYTFFVSLLTTLAVIFLFERYNSILKYFIQQGTKHFQEISFK